MTHNVIFSASQTALWQVKCSIENFPSDDKYSYDYLRVGTSCILCCSVAFEALVNEVFLDNEIIPHWDELKLRSKVDVLFQVKGKKIDWGATPFQRIGNLIKVRNWLSHHKEPHLGLANGDGNWVYSEGKLQAPRIDIQQELRESSIKKYYNAVRKAGIQIATIYDNQYNLEWLETEKYDDPLIM